MITAAITVVLLAFSLDRIISGIPATKKIKWKHAILAAIALVIIWGLICLIITVSAGLSHSERIKSLTPVRCLLSFFIIVGLPAASFVLLRYRGIIKEPDKPQLKTVSIIFFSILISVIFLLAAKSGMWPPLAVATKYHFSRTSQLLIEMGADIHEKDAYGFTPIWYAAGNGDLSTTELLVEKGADLHAWGASLLGVACQNGNQDVAEFLVDRGVDVDAIVYQHPEWTPLMAAVNAGHLNVVKMLVQKGASLDLPDKSGKTALMIAEGRKQIQIAEFLKAAKAESIKRKRDQ